MMTKLSLILLILFISFGCTENDNRNINNNVKLKKTSHFSYPGRITRVFVDDQGIYVSGEPEKRLLAYTFEGKVKKYFGKKGEAPWEHSSIWYFKEHDDKQHYWIHDYTKQLLKKYAIANDSMISSTKIILKNNVLSIGQDRFILPRLTRHDKGEFVFSIFNASTEKYESDIHFINNLDNRVKEQSYQDYIFYGEFCEQIVNNKAVFYCLYSGVFFIIDISNNSIQIVNDVRNLPIPNSNFIDNHIVLDPQQTVFISGAVKDDKIYLLTAQEGDFYVNPNKTFFIDRYSLNGSYIDSFELPALQNHSIPTNIDINKNKLIVNYGAEELVVYELSLNNTEKLK